MVHDPALAARVVVGGPEPAPRMVLASARSQVRNAASGSAGVVVLVRVVVFLGADR